ncbi:MAG: hypothetical protein ACFFC3_14675 [Candidatus Odinarchaeota archaeon]
MLQKIEFLTGIQKLLSYNNVISISGESGTGKTALALYLMGNIITSTTLQEKSSIWIQASEPFPKKRLFQLFEYDLDKLQYLQNNIYIQPRQSSIKTLEEQKKIIDTLITPLTILPPEVVFIVIDNISYHLRYEFHQTHNFKLLDRFYEDQLVPLILFCKREYIYLILIHEVTFSPQLDKIKPFFYKLYDRIEKIDIVLSHIANNKKKSINISYKKAQWSFQYILTHKGIKII